MGPELRKFKAMALCIPRNAGPGSTRVQLGPCCIQLDYAHFATLCCLVQRPPCRVLEWWRVTYPPAGVVRNRSQFVEEGRQMSSSLQSYGSMIRKFIAVLPTATAAHCMVLVVCPRCSFVYR